MSETVRECLQKALEAAEWKLLQAELNLKLLRTEQALKLAQAEGAVNLQETELDLIKEALGGD